jgi:acyl-CoA synthetase (AMP-forming)/AMP-acid ligase II
MDFVETMFAAALLGAVTVPVNARYMPPELAYLVENADLKVLVTTDKIAEAVNFVERLNLAFPHLPQADARSLDLEDAPRLRNIVLYGNSEAGGMLTENQFSALAEQGDMGQIHVNRLQVRLGSTALILYTSGTTANPKGCMISHEAIVRNSVALADRYELGGEDSFWSPLPMFHIAAILPLVAIFAKGGTYVTTGYFQAGEALKKMEQEKVTAT